MTLDEQLFLQAVDRLVDWINAHPLPPSDGPIVPQPLTDRDWVIAIYRHLRFGGLPHGREERARVMTMVHLVLDDTRLDA